MTVIEQINTTIGFIRSISKFNPEIGIILGSGLGNFSNEIEVVKEIAYEDIPNFPVVPRA